MDRVLTVVEGGSLIGVIVVGMAVVMVSALGQPVRLKAGTRKQTRHFSFTAKCLRCYDLIIIIKVARVGWPASAMRLAFIQPIR